MYIHERNNWTSFIWDASALTAILEEVGRKRGLLYGRLASLGFGSKLKAMAENLTFDVVYSSEIEGVRLNVDEVRSSIARKLGIENMKYTASSHYVDSVVAVMLDAVSHYDQPLTKEKICAWQAAFFLSPYILLNIPMVGTDNNRIVLDCMQPVVAAQQISCTVAFQAIRRSCVHHIHPHTDCSQSSFIGDASCRYLFQYADDKQLPVVANPQSFCHMAHNRRHIRRINCLARHIVHSDKGRIRHQFYRIRIDRHIRMVNMEHHTSFLHLSLALHSSAKPANNSFQ